MQLNIKLFNGDMIVLDEKDNNNIIEIENSVRNVLNDNTNVIIIEEVERGEGIEENGNKNYTAYIIPIHKFGEEYTTFLFQYTTSWTRNSEDNQNIMLINEMINECRECAEKNGYTGIISSKPDLMSYFNQLTLFFNIQENRLRGDSIVHIMNVTAIEFFADVLTNTFSKEIELELEFKKSFKEMLKTSDQVILEKVTKNILYNFTPKCRELKFEDFILSKNLIFATQLLNEIGKFNNPNDIYKGLYNIFDDIVEINIDEIDDLFEKQCTSVTEKEILGLIKYYMNPC